MFAFSHTANGPWFGPELGKFYESWGQALEGGRARFYGPGELEEEKAKQPVYVGEVEMINLEDVVLDLLPNFIADIKEKLSEDYEEAGGDIAAILDEYVPGTESDMLKWVDFNHFKLWEAFRKNYVPQALPRILTLRDSTGTIIKKVKAVPHNRDLRDWSFPGAA